ncbi:hypothetical protein [Pseudomonas syringae]|uniref:hypothetical protein n=1 Tax=Pseudomonas syringae TaxID=317 RepID=UPI0016050821|nr:hypothetical protein [Pseudomonas syringae]
MTNNKPNDVRVSRELLELLFSDEPDGYVTRMNARQELRALLAQPADLQGASLAIPDECPHMIVFDDADRENLSFAGCGARQAALKTFEQISGSWNAHLFVRVARNSRDDRYPSASVVADQQGEPVAWANGEQLLLCSHSRLDVGHSNPIYHHLPRNIAGSALKTEYCDTPLYRHLQPATAKVDELSAFSAWKGYPLPGLNADGQFDKEYLQREWVSWQARAKLNTPQ